MLNEMKNKRLFYMLIALAILLGVIYYIDDKPDAVRFDSELCNFDREAITRIELRPANLDEAIAIYRQGESWSLRYAGREFMADQERVKILLNYFYELEALRIVANHERNLPEYQLGEGEASFVGFYKEDAELCEMYIGRLSYDAARNVTNTNVRQSGDERTYLVAGNFIAQVAVRPEELISHSVSGAFEPEFVNTIELIRDHELLWRWTRNDMDNTWVNENYLTAATDKMQRYLRSVSRLNIPDIHTGIVASELNPQYSMRIGFEDDSSMKLHFAMDDEMAFISSSYRKDEVVFATSARNEQLTQLLKRSEDFLPDVDFD